MKLGCKSETRFEPWAHRTGLRHVLLFGIDGSGPVPAGPFEPGGGCSEGRGTESPARNAAAEGEEIMVAALMPRTAWLDAMPTTRS